MAARKSSGAGSVPKGLPVRPHEDPWTAEEVAELQRTLEHDIAHLQREINTVEHDIAALIDDAGADVGDDTADAGAKAF